MPSRKKTRTTASDFCPTRSTSKFEQVRRMVAAEAARIMATEAQSNYRIAKLKAAHRLGAGADTALPSNLEVEHALRDYQAFYGGTRHLDHLFEMRSAALRAMRLLEPFHPRLVGPVLDGTADEYARVTLHVFNDPPDAVSIHLLEKGLHFSSEQRRIRWHDGGHRLVPLLVVHAPDTDIELALFACVDLRQAPPSPIDGRPLKRAPVTEVECLLAGAC
ncbi:MAG: hypothetical protein PVJ71_02145 [Lysobacterales bacterium]